MRINFVEIKKTGKTNQKSSDVDATIMKSPSNKRPSSRFVAIRTKRRRTQGKSNMEVRVESRERLKVLDTSEEVHRQMSAFADIHTIFGITGMLSLIIEYADSRDIHLFFSELIEKYSTLILESSQQLLRPTSRQSLVRAWTPRCHEMMQQEISMRWMRDDYHTRVQFPINMFKFVIFKVLQRNWVEVFINARKEVNKRPCSSRGFFFIKQLICQTQHIANWPTTHQVLAPIPQFNILLRVINTPSPRAVCYPAAKTEVAAIIRDESADTAKFRPGELSRFLKFRLPMIIHQILRARGDCPSWGILRQTTEHIQMMADTYFETTYMLSIGVDAHSAYYSRVLGCRVDPDDSDSDDEYLN